MTLVFNNQSARTAIFSLSSLAGVMYRQHRKSEIVVSRSRGGGTERNDGSEFCRSFTDVRRQMRRLKRTSITSNDQGSNAHKKGAHGRQEESAESESET